MSSGKKKIDVHAFVADKRALSAEVMKHLIHALLLCLVAIGPYAFAHHFFAMYDSKQLITVTGTVKLAPPAAQSDSKQP